MYLTQAIVYIHVGYIIFRRKCLNINMNIFLKHTPKYEKQISFGVPEEPVWTYNYILNIGQDSSHRYMGQYHKSLFFLSFNFTSRPPSLACTRVLPSKNNCLGVFCRDAESVLLNYEDHLVRYLSQFVYIWKRGMWKLSYQESTGWNASTIIILK